MGVITQVKLAEAKVEVHLRKSLMTRAKIEGEKGNCLFQSLAKCVKGDEGEHLTVRK